MRNFLLPEKGVFYKANLHCHSTVSDGVMTPSELKTHYQRQGYSIIAFTDHDVMIAHPELADDTFLPLNGYEMYINDERTAPFDIYMSKACHICFIALEPDNLKQVCYHRSKYLWGNAVQYAEKIQFDETQPDYIRQYSHECISDMMKKGRENGFFVTYNHPAWSLENYNDYMGYNHMHAMEIFNSTSDAEGFCEYNEKEYDDMLRGGKRIFCIAADDTHGYRECFGGFTMIKAQKLDYRTVTEALINGDFYASQGPEIYNLWFEDSRMYIECSDAERIVLNTGTRRADVLKAANGEIVNGANFEVLPQDVYVRITITDKKGKHANTNAYFTDELFGATKNQGEI